MSDTKLTHPPVAHHHHAAHVHLLHVIAKHLMAAQPAGTLPHLETAHAASVKAHEEHEAAIAEAVGALAATRGV